ARGVGVEVDVERRRGRAVEDADDVCSRALPEGRPGGSQDRIVLDAIGPSVGVAVVVRRHARLKADGEIDAEAARRRERLVPVDAVSSDPDLLTDEADAPATAEDAAVERD